MVKGLHWGVLEGPPKERIAFFADTGSSSISMVDTIIITITIKVLAVLFKWLSLLLYAYS